MEQARPYISTSCCCVVAKQLSAAMLRSVEVLCVAKNCAPTASKITASSTACFIVRALAPTAVAQELPQSLAAMPNENPNALIAPKTSTHTYSMYLFPHQQARKLAANKPDLTHSLCKSYAPISALKP
eukprot:9116-Heterococcus_DN1.PRE.2